MFSGADGASYFTSAYIQVSANGTVAATRVPTIMQFATGTDAAPTVSRLAMTIQNNQQFLFAATLFAALGTPADGHFTYCSNCDPPPAGAVTACPSAGTQAGAFAIRVNATWGWW